MSANTLATPDTRQALRHIDNSFYRLTHSQAKTLSVTGKLPRAGYENRAKPASELNAQIVLTHQTRFARAGEWTEGKPISEGAQCWVKATPLSWHNGKPVAAGWVYALHVYEPV